MNNNETVGQSTPPLPNPDPPPHPTHRSWLPADEIKKEAKKKKINDSVIMMFKLTACGVNRREINMRKKIFLSHPAETMIWEGGAPIICPPIKGR